MNSGVTPGVTSGWSAHECVVLYNVPSNVIQLAQDAGGAFLPNTATAGTPQIVSNSQCTVIGSGSSATVSGSTVTVTLLVGFTAAFGAIQGTTKGVFMSAVDAEGNFTNPIQKGSYTVGSNVTALSIAPLSGDGSGTNQIFSVAVSDPNGESSISDIFMNFFSQNNSIASANGCGIRYAVPTGVISLINDAGTAFETSTVTAGSSGTLSNSQCTISAPGSGVTPSSGNTLNANLSFSFSPSFTGPKFLTLSGGDVNGNGEPNQAFGNLFTGNPACAASASGALHIICVVSSGPNNELFAATQAETAGSTTTLQNPAVSWTDLHVTGTVGSSSCSSAADGTADVVCAYNNNGTLYGIRFNVVNTPLATPANQFPPQNLGITVTPGANASCAIGDARFALIANNGQHGNPTSEGLPGQTICAVRSSNNELMGVAFNPDAATAKEVVDLGFEAIGDPSCTYPNIAALTAPSSAPPLPITCVANSSSGLMEVTFDPRVTTNTATPYSLLSGTTFINSPGCTSPTDTSVDKSGDIICAMTTSSNTLEGFSFVPGTSPNASTPTSIPPSSVTSFFPGTGTTVTGSPSCAGFGANGDADSGSVVCTTTLKNSNTIQSIAFNKTGTVVGPGLQNATSPSQIVGSTTGQTTGSNPSCTWQNRNPDAVSCGGITTNKDILFVIPDAPPGALKFPPQ
jgi:hypothetical protein